MSITKREAIANGYTCYCPRCSTAYKKIPIQVDEDGVRVAICNHCGCHVFTDIVDDTQAF